MRIEVTTIDPKDRTSATLVLNGREIPIPKTVELDGATDESIVAFFAGYSVAMADVGSKLAETHKHDH